MLEEPTTIHHYELRARTAKVLLQRLYREMSTLVVEEVDFAKAEIDRDGGVRGVARSFMLSVAFGFLALACLTACAILLLCSLMNPWEATLVIALIFGLVSLVLRISTVRAIANIAKPVVSRLGVLFAPLDKGTALAERKSRVEWTRRQVAQTMAALEQKTDVVTPLRQTVLGLGSLGVAVSAIIHSGE